MCRSLTRERKWAEKESNLRRFSLWGIYSPLPSTARHTRPYGLLIDSPRPAFCHQKPMQKDRP